MIPDLSLDLALDSKSSATSSIYDTSTVYQSPGERVYNFAPSTNTLQALLPWAILAGIGLYYMIKGSR